MKKKLSLLALSVLLTSVTLSNSYAGECKVHYKRTACKGQEEISYKKCDGNAECDKTKPAESKEECTAAALKACDNDRLDITKWKAITATYDGEQLVGGFTEDGKVDAAGTNFCAGDRKDLNQCE